MSALMVDPGTPVTVDYLSRDNSVHTVSGHVVAGRYPHMYLTVAPASHAMPMDIPLERVKRVNGRVIL
jgi:hypothetical protein